MTRGIRALLLGALLLTLARPAAALDCFNNFAYADLSQGYAAGDTVVVVAATQGTRFPVITAACPGYNATYYDATLYTSATLDPNREIVRITGLSGDTLTIVRAQEGTTARAHNTLAHTYRLDATLTAKTLAEIYLTSLPGTFNYFAGGQAGNLSASSTQNSAFGYAALHNLTSGTNNTAIGVDALLGNTQGANNTAVGVNACATNSIGFSLTCLGYNAGAAATTAESSVFLGTRAGESITTSNFNVFIGSFSGQIETGQASTYVGYKSGFVSTGGDRNTYLGDSAAFTATTGDDNTIVGYNAGNGLTTGSGNTIIGANLTGIAGNLANTVVLGDGSGNNRLQVSSTGNVVIPGTGPAASLGSGGTYYTAYNAASGGGFIAGTNVVANGSDVGYVDAGTFGTAGGEKRAAAMHAFLEADATAAVTGGWRFYTTNAGTIGERWRMPATGGLVAGTAKILLAGTGTGPSQLAISQTTAPTCATNCGTSPTLAGSDSAFRVTMGAAGVPASGFIVTFNGTWAAAPVCTGNMALAGMVAGKLPLTLATTTTTLTVVTNGTAPANSDVYTFHCTGVQ